MVSSALQVQDSNLSKAHPSQLRGLDFATAVGQVLFIVLERGMNAVPQERQHYQVACDKGSNDDNRTLAPLATPGTGPAIGLWFLFDAHGTQGAVVTWAALLAHVAAGKLAVDISFQGAVC